MTAAGLFAARQRKELQSEKFYTKVVKQLTGIKFEELENKDLRIIAEAEAKLSDSRGHRVALIAYHAEK